MTFDGHKEVRRERRRAREEVLKHTHLKKFKKEIREAVLALVNDHGVKYRVQRDGQHVLLYSGGGDMRPLKVGATRNPEAQMRYLREWASENVPEFYN